MRRRTEHYYVFGPFRLDPEEYRLQRDGLVVPLTPKTLAMLLILVRNSGSLVEKDVLMRELWPDAFVEESNLTFSISVIRKALSETAQTASYIETVPKRGYRFVAPVKEVRTENNVTSLAVLPFVNLSSQEGGDYLAEGIQDALISELTQIGSLRVISRASSMQYKTSVQPLSDFARVLQLDVAVEGSVLLEGDLVKINVRLIDAVRDRHLWAQGYERNLRDILAWQSEVARTIVRKIEVKVTPSEETRLQSTRAVDPEAHAAYLKGRYYWHQFFTEGGMKTAIAHFRQAIDLEPGYARAWSFLSACFTAMAVQSMLPPVEAAVEGKSAAKHALALDPFSAEAHVSMAAIHLFFDWDWPAAEGEIKSAIELSPGCEAQSLFTHYALARGWGRQAIASQHRALDLDPMSAAMNADLVWAYLLSREYEKSLELSLSTLRMKFNYPLLHVYLAQTYICMGNYAEAIAELEGVLPPDEEPPAAMLAILGYAYGVAGRNRSAQDMLSRMENLSMRSYVSSYDFAVLYAGLGEKDHALKRLQQGVDDREPRVIWLNVEPTFDSLRKEQPFQDLVLRLNLE